MQHSLYAMKRTTAKRSRLMLLDDWNQLPSNSPSSMWNSDRKESETVRKASSSSPAYAKSSSSSSSSSMLSPPLPRRRLSIVDESKTQNI